MTKIFSFFNLSLASRLIIASFLYAACVLLQLGLGQPVLGLLLAIPAWFVLGLKTIKNKPDDQGLENWRAVGEAEVNRIADTLKQSKKLQSKLAGPGCLRVFAWLATAVLGVFSGGLSRSGYGAPFGLALIDLAIFTLPAVFFGSVQLFIPHELNMKVDAFLPVMNADRPKDIVLTPYIRFDEDKQKNEIPEDLRFMVEPRRKPDELVGVQLQLSVNKGPNGAVPYMYAVVLMRGRNSKLYRTFANISVDGYEIEAGGDDEYGTVVIRQQTGGTGYHTKPNDCLRLFQLVIKALQQVLAAA